MNFKRKEAKLILKKTMGVYKVKKEFNGLEHEVSLCKFTEETRNTYR